MWRIRTLFSKVLSVIFPTTCFLCRKKEESLCKECLGRLRKSLEPPFLYITSVYGFKDQHVKKIIHAIKYFHRSDLIAPLTRALVHELKVTRGDTLQDGHYILVPIPMPKARKYMRGYNHAEKIAQELGKQLSLEVVSKVLTRTKSSKRQVTTKTRRERLHNQHNSFKVTTTVLHKNIIVVDDVTTTGATLREARRILLEAGASDVIAVTLAH